ncbi:MAG: hypothetical protein JKX87_02215 [Cycloclasticus sp.]|nr:hypothetical protein [Cycloclasticus sp.]
MKKLYAVLMLLVFLAPTTAISGEDTLVAMVTSNLSLTDNKTLDIKAIRKLYLGFKSAAQQKPVEVVVNVSDEQLYQSFLQRVMYMSAKKFQRISVAKFFRHGGKLIQNIDNTNELAEKLSSNSNVVSFIWAKDLKRYKHLKVIKIL